MQFRETVPCKWSVLVRFLNGWKFVLYRARQASSNWFKHLRIYKTFKLFIDTLSWPASGLIINSEIEPYETTSGLIKDIARLTCNSNWNLWFNICGANEESYMQINLSWPYSLGWQFPTSDHMADALMGTRSHYQVISLNVEWWKCQKLRSAIRWRSSFLRQKPMAPRVFRKPSEQKQTQLKFVARVHQQTLSHAWKECARYPKT